MTSMPRVEALAAPQGARAFAIGARRSVPIGSRPIVVIDFLAARTVRPIPALMLAVPGRPFELLLGDIDFIAVEPWVVGQYRPRQRIVIFADPHEAAEAHDRIGDLAADLVDHDPFDSTGLFAVRAIDRRAFHLVAADEAHGFPLIEGRRRGDSHSVLLFMNASDNAFAPSLFRRPLKHGLGTKKSVLDLAGGRASGHL